MKKNKKVMLSAVVAGILAAGVSAKVARADENPAGSEGKYECKGGNSCRAQGACGGPGHGCAGKNECRGKGWVFTKDKEDCEIAVRKAKATPKKTPAKKDADQTT